jgi:hypothetical protein
VEKNIRKAGRPARQTGKAAVDAEWQRLLQEHNMNIDKWSAECEELGSKNIPKKNWPKKPTRSLKPKIPQASTSTMPTITTASSSAVTLEMSTAALQGQVEESESEESGEEFN